MMMPTGPHANNSPKTLIATLGGQPQIVSFALDALLKRNRTISKVVLLAFKPESDRLSDSLERISAEIESGAYADHPIELQTFFVGQPGRPLSDIQNEAEASIAWDSINGLICGLKDRYETLDVCISGGRRMLSLITMSAATTYFGHDDNLWHMYTAEVWQKQVRAGQMMHLPEAVGMAFG